jgi:hypothetical protein
MSEELTKAALGIVRGKLSRFPDHGARDGVAVYKITGEELGAITDALEALAPQAGEVKPVAWCLEDERGWHATRDQETADYWLGQKWPLQPLFTHPPTKAQDPDVLAERAARVGLGWAEPEHDGLIEKLKSGDGSDYMVGRWLDALRSARAALAPFSVQPEGEG